MSNCEYKNAILLIHTKAQWTYLFVDSFFLKRYKTKFIWLNTALILSSLWLILKQSFLVLDVQDNIYYDNIETIY